MTEMSGKLNWRDKVSAISMSVDQRWFWEAAERDHIVYTLVATRAISAVTNDA